MKGSPFALGTIAAVASAIVLAEAQHRRPITIDDEMQMKAIVDVRISPDGERVAYVVSTPNLEKNEHDAAIFVVPAQGGAATRLGEALLILNQPLPAPQLRWAPDGSAVAVLAFAAERPQVFLVPPTGAPRALTTAPEGVSAFEWSPDGTRLAYLTLEPMSANEARQRRERSFVIRADAPERPTRLNVVPLDGSGARTLSPLSHYVDSFSWAPNGSEIAYSAAPRSGFGSAYETRLYIVSTEGGPPRAIVDRTGMNTMPQFSPDGRFIAFISTNGRVEIMAPRSLTVASADRSSPPRTFLLQDAWVNELVWARDSRSVYLQANDGLFASREHMFEQPIVRVKIDGDGVERIASGADVHFSLSISRNGALAYRGINDAEMGDVFVLDAASRRARKLTDVNPQLRELAVGKLEPISWRSFDGMQIWGLLLTPPGWSAGRIPLLVYVHGGPGGGVTFGHFPQFMSRVGQVDPYPTQAMASAGFAVLFPMPRGGAGYGEAGQRAIVNAWGEADYRDIMAGVDELIARGIADPDRLGVMGASYGGYMTNWMVTQAGRFKAASAAASISDLTDPYYLSEGGQFMVEYFKLPWENRQSYVQHSPITHAGRVSTPLLIQHGENDPRVPIAGAWKFYRALKARGKTVELDIHPRGRHVLYEPMQQREAMRRNLEWFNRWITVERNSGFRF
jgi:dipeptidyl aminopeptidase/acylaminoacyl peptidase